MLVRQANNWILESVKFASYVNCSGGTVVREVGSVQNGGFLCHCVGTSLLNCYVYHG